MFLYNIYLFPFSIKTYEFDEDPNHGRIQPFGREGGPTVPKLKGWFQRLLKNPGVSITLTSCPFRSVVPKRQPFVTDDPDMSEKNKCCLCHVSIEFPDELMPEPVLPTKTRKSRIKVVLSMIRER